MFNFLQKHQDVLPFVETIKNAADNEKKSLGFLSAKAYETAAYNEKILIATCQLSGQYRFKS